jgi:hypothetical protein
MIAQLPNLNAILKRHEIHPKFWPAIRALVEEGQRPNKELTTRLNHVRNYKAAVADIIAELSKGLDHQFPPADYQTPADYQLYEGQTPESFVPESLTPEDVVLATSGG